MNNSMDKAAMGDARIRALLKGVYGESAFEPKPSTGQTEPTAEESGITARELLEGALLKRKHRPKDGCGLTHRRAQMNGLKTTKIDKGEDTL